VLARNAHYCRRTARGVRFALRAPGDALLVGEKPLQGVALILHTIELTIAQVEERIDDPDRDENLEVLREMRRRWQAQTDEQPLPHSQRS
jgi:hypothetical protein